MTDSEIIKALECCANFAQCTGCGYYKERDRCCVDAVMQDAVSMLKRQQAEIERLQDTNRQLETDNFNANMNLDLVQQENDNLIRNYKECAMEAVRDFAGRLIKRHDEFWRSEEDMEHVVAEIVAEMEGKA